MRVAVLFEFSGRVRDAFITQGHEAISFDLLPTERPGPHIIGDVREHDYSTFDLAICHPPCTYLSNSGIRWLYIKGNSVNGRDKQRWEAMYEAVKLFNWCLNLPVPRICVENPRPHIHAGICESSQIIHPWQFGHGETKETHLWLINLPYLEPTNIVPGRGNSIHYESPGPNRARNRSRTFQGIADAFSSQWQF